MRILILHNSYKMKGGEDVVVGRETELLRSGGLDVRTFIMNNDQIQTVRDAMSAGLHCNYSSGSKHLIEEELRRWRPDICHVHNTFPLLTASVYDACGNHGVPVVQTLHNYRAFCANGLLLREQKPCELCLQGSAFHAIRYGCYRGSRILSVPVARMIQKQRREKTLAAKVQTILAASPFAARKFLAGGLPAGKLKVKTNFSPDLEKRRGPEGSYAVYLGRLSEEKGVAALIDGWPPAACDLSVIGSGPMEKELRARALRRNIRFFQGETWQEAMDLLSRARFLIMPTQCFEGGFPLVLMEAMSMKVPVIASDIGSIPDFIIDRENGLLVEAGNPESIKRAAISLSSDAGLRTRLGERGRNTYLKHFTPEQNLNELLAIYKDAIMGFGGGKSVNR